MNRFYLISPLVLQTLIWPITRPILRFFLHLNIRGQENLESLDRSRGIVFACNHSSELDPIIVPASLPFLSPLMPMFYTSREQKFYQNSGWRRLFYGGLFFAIWGSHRLQSGKHDYAESLKTHIKILGCGKSLLIFPEGRKTRDGNLQEGHGGVAFLAIQLGTPVVPVRIAGHFRLSFLDFLLRRRRVQITFGTPLRGSDLVDSLKLDSTSMSPKDYRAIASLVMNQIAKL